jgi:hypothetical protein
MLPWSSPRTALSAPGALSSPSVVNNERVRAPCLSGHFRTSLPVVSGLAPPEGSADAGMAPPHAHGIAEAVTRVTRGKAVGPVTCLLQ